MNNKTYTLSIKHPGTGAVLSIGAYCDTPGKPFRIYLDGSDIGRRYERLGNAARCLDDIARTMWHSDEITKGTVNDVPTRGASWNVLMYQYWYCGGPWPTWDKHWTHREVTR